MSSSMWLCMARQYGHRRMITGPKHRRLLSDIAAPSSSSSPQGVAQAASSSSSSSSSATIIPIRRTVTKAEREILRAERKKKASAFLQQQQTTATTRTTTGDAAASGSSSIAAANGAGSSTFHIPSAYYRYIWYVGLGLPTALLVWGFNDENSPPAKFCNATGITGFVSSYTEQFAKPSRNKLLPDWENVPNVPPGIPCPHTLVLDLENTLISSTWDRKLGWRHAKRPGVDKFLTDLSQYYEIVLYTPSDQGIIEPVVNSLDKNGCFLHRLYRDATYYTNGVHVKDLSSLNRNLNRMIVIDDNPQEVQLNPENLIRVKPYINPNDREDNTLQRITPFLIEIAREGYNNIPELLQQYQGLDADEIADEYQNRILQYTTERRNISQRGMGRFTPKGRELPDPELPPTDYLQMSDAIPTQMTAKDVVGAGPPGSSSSSLAASGSGISGWLNRRKAEKEEHHMRKMEKWQEVMMKKQQQKEEELKRLEEDKKWEKAAA